MSGLPLLPSIRRTSSSSSGYSHTHITAKVSISQLLNYLFFPQIFIIYSGLPSSSDYSMRVAQSGSRSIEHPLLSVTDPRNSRPRPSIFTATSSSSSNSSSRNWMFDTIFPQAIADSNGISITNPFLSNYEPNRNSSGVQNRRRMLGPQLSDRRWGTDLSALDLLDTRIDVLISNVQECIPEVVEINKALDSNKKGDKSSKPQPRLLRRTYGTIESFEDREDHDYYPTDYHTNDQMDETKDEGELQETKEDVPYLPFPVFPFLSSSSSSSSQPATEAGTEPSANSNLTTTLANAFSIIESLAPQNNSISLDFTAINNTLGVNQTNTVTRTATESSQLTHPHPEQESELQSTSHSHTPISSSTSNTSQPSNQTQENHTELQPAAVSASDNHNLPCPSSISPLVWDELPLECRLEILESEANENLLQETELDREVLAALPPDVRNEILIEEATNRRRRNSITDGSYFYL